MCIPTPIDPTRPAKEITEAHLAAVWNEQAPLSGPMWDCHGDPVAVIYRGRWTAGSGPDFSGAMLSVGEGTRLVRGDVVMHLRCADWYAHGHDSDPRYNSVVLHVVLWPLGVKPVTRADGVAIPTLVLADYITLPTPDLLRRIEPLMPNLGTLSEEPCWQRTQTWPIEGLIRHIEAAGDARMQEKAARIEAACHAHGSLDAAFYSGLMDALGYSSNREPMRETADALPLEHLALLPLTSDEAERAVLLEAEAALLGTAGLLPSQRPDLTSGDWTTDQYVEEVERLWAVCTRALSVSPNGLVQGWQWDRVRPANSPLRRLAASARLLARYGWPPADSGMLAPFLSHMDSDDADSSITPIDLAKEWTGMLSVPGDGYWAAHSDFGRPLTGMDKEEVALVGTARTSDMVVNILIPTVLTYADTHGRPGVRDQAAAVYEVYPKLADNKITRAMLDEVFGPRKRAAVRTARQQQGLLHLYRLYCEARRCYECPVSGMQKGARGMHAQRLP